MNRSCCFGLSARGGAISAGRLRVSIIVCLAVALLDLSAFASSQQTYLEVLVDFERYAETIWHSASYSNAPPDSGYWGDGNSGGNGGIRGNCGVAVSYAVLARAYPSATNRPVRIARIRQALNYAANTHFSGTNVCVDSNRWGNNWQTSLWAGSMGLAGFLAQADLPPSTVQAVRRALEFEAAYRAGIAPASRYAGDTAAEENGWNGNVVALAAAWLSTNSQSAVWLDSAKRYLANTYTVANTNGDPLVSWLTTVTLYPDFSLENHGFYHPTYQMVAGMSMGDSLLMARLMNPSVATQLQPFAEHNVLQVWTNLSHLVLDSGEFAYPSGLDWELHDYEQDSYIAWLATHFNDPLARWADGQLAKLVRHRQFVNGDGRFVGSTGGGGFFREAVEARRTAIAWLHWNYADYTSGPASPPGTAFEHLTDVKIIAQRGPFGFFSLSYGPRIMAVIEPPALSVPTNAFVTTPRVPGILGLGALGNPTGSRLISLVTNLNGFQAELQLTNSGLGTTEIYVNCSGESIAIVEVPQPRPGISGSAAASFCTGIENDPLIGGTRALEWTGGSATMTNRSGAFRNVTNNWVCVAGRYGVAAGPSGYFNYQAAASYNRAGAAEDTLQFIPASPLGPRYAVWFPGKNASQTLAGASQITWTVSSTNGVLTFPGPGGAATQIAFELQVTPPAYTPYVLPVESASASSMQTSFPPANVVDGNLNNFWVSSGTSAGQGPTLTHPEWLRFAFPRRVAISEFQVYPRTFNGGYGPKAVQMLLDGALVYQDTMAATSTLDITLAQPVYATNAQLLITSSYDPGSPANPRNVQVVETIFFERALPDSFGDWALHQFTDVQLGDPAQGAPQADPDKDGVGNLAEFALGGNPLLADGATLGLQLLPSPTGTFALTFRERMKLGDVQYRFERSSNLVNWTEIAPSSLVTVSNLPGVYLRGAVFPAQDTAGYFRLRFSVQSGP